LMGLLAATSPSPEGTDGKFSVGALLGYGVGFDSPNVYSFGVGGRSGYTTSSYTFPVRVYAGVSFLYYNGSSQYLPFIGTSRVRIWTLMAEFGHEFVVRHIEVRPFLGLGVGVLTRTDGVLSSSTAYFGLTPGVVAIYSFNGPLSTGPFVGTDFHITWLPSPNAAIANDLSLLATGGYRL
jgi:hypothetical protein